MFGLVYGSFMINEVDIVFSKWTQVFISTVEQLYLGAPGYSYSVAGKAAGCVKNIQHYHHVCQLYCGGSQEPSFPCMYAE